MSRHSMRTVVWKFCDSAETPAELRDKGKITLRDAGTVYETFKFLFTDQVRERFVVIWLSASNGVVGFEVVAEGILNSTLVHPREVFRGAIVKTAASIIVAHNHPSDMPEPSPEDLIVTQQLVASGEIIGIKVTDHIIFTNDTYTSFAERGLL